jgi:CBS domain-containing protein
VAIAEHGKFIGVLAERDMESFEAEKKIDSNRYNIEQVSCPLEATWMDVLELFARNEANILPVLDEDVKVVGYYDLTEIVGMFIEIPFFTEQGAILVVAKGSTDYSFSEIAQIVESNNTKLIGAFITDSRDEVVQITMKLSAGNLNEVVQTFRRYNYTILFGSKDDQFLKDLKQRSDYLNKYLNV